MGSVILIPVAAIHVLAIVTVYRTIWFVSTVLSTSLSVLETASIGLLRLGKLM